MSTCVGLELVDGCAVPRKGRHCQDKPHPRVTYLTYGRYSCVMSSKLEILDHAVAVLRRGEPLTLDAVAREAGLTKPGVVHHFPTKEKLVVGVMDRITDRWEADFTAQAP